MRKARLLSDTADLNLSWRDKRYERFYAIVDQLVNELQTDASKTKRRLAGIKLQKLHYSVECLLRDCMAVVLQRQRISDASIKLGKHHYQGDNPDKMLTFDIHIGRAFKGLLELDYLNISQNGYFDRKGRKDGTPRSRLTRYYALDKILKLFSSDEIKAIPAIIPPYINPQLIRVRVNEVDKSGVNRKVTVPFLEMDETVRMRSNLQTINKALSKHWYDLEITDEELSNLQLRLSEDKLNERHIRMDQRSLHRVFNDCDLITGGRFYGGWWQNIPREFRQHLAVNGKRMVELDYSNQHPSILYAWEGAERPTDCYSEVIKLDQLPVGLTHKDLRNMVKEAFNAMLNSPRPLRNAPNEIKPSRFGLKWKDLSDAIIAFHEPIAHHFYSSVGLKLQRLDSDIAEKILLHFAEKEIAILPLHDSFLMHHGYETSLQPVMNDVFKEIVGSKPKVDKKQFPKRLQLENGRPDDEFDLEQLLKALDVGCEHRLEAFRRLRTI